MAKKSFKMRKNLIPKPAKIFKRGLYEAMWGAEPRNYDKMVNPKKKEKKCK